MIYNTHLQYEDNYAFGPFRIPLDGLPKQMFKQTEFFGLKVDIPFGIPAGPLLTSRHILGAWKLGYAIATYKTVRGTSYPCHPFPNVIKITSHADNVRPGDTVFGDTTMNHINVATDGITNSFGVPSQSPSVWFDDVKQALKLQTAGNVMILSFMGTKQIEMTKDDYIADFVRTIQLATSSGASILEVNFSCPNVGKEGLICNDPEISASLLEAMKSSRGNVPLLVKIGYFPKESQGELERLLDAIHEYANGVVAINTIQAKVVDKNGNQVLPGSPVRMMSGICGASIRWAGLEMAERIVAYKKRKNWKDFTVVGVGGVVTADDYWEYMKRGVDAVQSATGSMWNLRLANEIRTSVSLRV